MHYFLLIYCICLVPSYSVQKETSNTDRKENVTIDSKNVIIIIIIIKQENDYSDVRQL